MPLATSYSNLVKLWLSNIPIIDIVFLRVTSSANLDLCLSVDNPASLQLSLLYSYKFFCATRFSTFPKSRNGETIINKKISNFSRSCKNEKLLWIDKHKTSLKYHRPCPDESQKFFDFPKEQWGNASWLHLRHFRPNPIHSTKLPL